MIHLTIFRTSKGWDENLERVQRVAINPKSICYICELQSTRRNYINGRTNPAQTELIPTTLITFMTGANSEESSSITVNEPYERVLTLLQGRGL